MRRVHSSRQNFVEVFVTSARNFDHIKKLNRCTKWLVLVNICSVEGNSAGIFVSKVSPAIFVIKVKWMPIIFGIFWVR